MEFTHIDEILREKGVYVGGVKGDSMMPLLREGIDRVVVEVPKQKPKKYDVALYKRGERYVMHRIVKVCKNDGYVIRGDNRINNERDITTDRIIGVMTGFLRGDKLIEVTDEKYKEYVKKIVRQYYPRKIRFIYLKVLEKLHLR